MSNPLNSPLYPLLFGFGTTTALFLKIISNCLLGRQPVTANLNSIDFTATKHSPEEAGGKTTDAGGLRDGDQL